MASSFETTLFPIVQTINEYLSNYVLVILLLGVGIWYTIKTRCVQVRCFKEGWNRVFGNITLNGKKSGGGMSLELDHTCNRSENLFLSHAHIICNIRDQCRFHKCTFCKFTFRTSLTATSNSCTF